MAGPIWVFDTSALIDIKSQPRESREAILVRLSQLAGKGRLRMPKQVLDELKRVTDVILEWALTVESKVTSDQPTLDDVKTVLSGVPSILDSTKDAGAEEADPYVLALALTLKQTGGDVRIVTQESKDVQPMPGKPARMSLNTAAGIMAIPSVPLRGFLHVEGMS